MSAKPFPEWDQWYRRGNDLCERIARKFPRTRDRIHADDGEVDAIWGGLDELLKEVQDAKAITEEQKQQVIEAERLVKDKEMQMDSTGNYHGGERGRPGPTRIRAMLARDTWSENRDGTIGVPKTETIEVIIEIQDPTLMMGRCTHTDSSTWAQLLCVNTEFSKGGNWKIVHTKPIGDDE